MITLHLFYRLFNNIIIFIKISNFLWNWIQSIFIKIWMTFSIKFHIKFTLLINTYIFLQIFIIKYYIKIILLFLFTFQFTKIYTSKQIYKKLKWQFLTTILIQSHIPNQPSILSYTPIYLIIQHLHTLRQPWLIHYIIITTQPIHNIHQSLQCPNTPQFPLKLINKW